MAHYTVFCEDCGSEYTVAGPELKDPPSTCTFCGSKLEDTNVTEETNEWSDDDWDKLADEGLDDGEWNWEGKD
jgi:hypothetical protein